LSNCVGFENTGLGLGCRPDFRIDCGVVVFDSFGDVDLVVVTLSFLTGKSIFRTTGIFGEESSGCCVDELEKSDARRNDDDRTNASTVGTE